METITVDNSGFSLAEKKGASDPAPQPAAAAGRQEADTITARVSQAYVRAPRPSPTKAEVADDDRAEHQRLVITLSRYGQSPRFSEYLRGLDFNLSVSHLRRQSLEDLKGVLERVRISAQNRSINNLFEDSIFGAISFGEICVSRSSLGEKLLVQGLTQALRADEGFLDAIESLSLDQGAINAGPEMRMAYSVISAVGKVHSINLFMRRRAEMMAANGGGVEQAQGEAKSGEGEEAAGGDDDAPTLVVNCD